MCLNNKISLSCFFWKLSLAILFFCSCGSNNDKYSEYFSPDELITTNTTEIVEYEGRIDTLCSSPDCYSYLEYRDYIVGFCSNSDKLIYVIDIDEDSIVASFGFKGKASNEFLSNPESPCIIYNDSVDLLCVIDKENNKLKYIDLKKSIESNSCVVAKPAIQIPIQMAQGNYDYFQFNKGSFGKMGYMTVDARDGIIEPPTYYIGKTSVSPFKIEKILTEAERNKMATMSVEFLSALKISPNQKKAVDMYTILDLFNIIDIESGKMKGVINENGPDFDVFENSDKLNDSEIYFHNFVHYASNNYIFILSVDNRLSIEKLNSNADSILTSLKPILNVYDYFGKHLHSIKLKSLYGSLIYIENRKELYAQSEDKLYKYDLSKYLK